MARWLLILVVLGSSAAFARRRPCASERSMASPWGCCKGLVADSLGICQRPDPDELKKQREEKKQQKEKKKVPTE